MFKVVVVVHGTIRNDNFQRNMSARTIFFATFGLRVFESASKTCNAKTRILLKLFHVTYLSLILLR